MITVMNTVTKPVNEVEKCLDSQLWHACAGGMVQMPPMNSKVFYFPQGHSEHAHEKVDFGNLSRVPPLMLCRVSGIKFLADGETDEVYAKIRLVPLATNNDSEFEDDDGGFTGLDKPEESQEKPPASFAKTLTQSDANNGGGFSVPRYCAETIFPRLDYSAEPPVQTILAKDVHGDVWKFRHIYRGTPRRHLLTTGWSNFVNQKKLVAGDSIVFLRADNGDLCVGIRRAKRGGIGGGGGGPEESPFGSWNALGGNCASPFVGYSAFLREDDTRSMRSGGNMNGSSMKGGKEGKVRGISVVEAATMAAKGQTFEVVYYPRASAPEFCVKASAVRAAMRIQWCPGMRFKMPFETEDSSRISWFMGTISSVQVDDPVRWPSSPWRLLQVAWDEPDLLQNVKQVSPWLVELVSVANMPAIHLSPFSPFSPPRKKQRVPQPSDFPFIGQHPMMASDFPFIGQHPMPSYPGSLLRPNNPFCCVPDNIPAAAGIQGARHAHFGGLSSADLLFSKLQQAGPFPQPPPRVPTEENTSLSSLLSMGVSSTENSKNSNEEKAPMFLLFGQPIHTKEQISLSSSDWNQEKTTLYFSDGSGSGVIQNGPPENSSDDGSPPWYKDNQKSEFGLEMGQCKVFMESEDVGRTLDLTALGSYEELYRKLADMFSVERSEMLSNVLYRDASGAVKHTEDEPFSDFSRTAKRLTILMDSGSDNMGR